MKHGHLWVLLRFIYLQNLRLQEKQNMLMTYNCLRMDSMQP
ncbi:hypothetical protein AAHE18_17G090000 [Arachis hypogaea]